MRMGNVLEILRNSTRCNCGSVCDNVIERHCVGCGAINPNFDAELFEEEFERPFEEARAKYCSSHEELVSDLKAHSLTKIVRRCPFCGKSPTQ